MKTINVHFLIFLLIATSVAISDIVIYLLRTDFIITNCLVLIINSLLVVCLNKKKCIEIKSNFSKFDFIFILGLFIYMLIALPFPDLSWDTRSYHIYLQENIFTEKIDFDFFAGRNLNSYLFALGDRINYLFRYVLGYRLGTIITYYAILILYYQVKKFITEIAKFKNQLIICIFSIFPCLASVIFSYVGTYYIDNYGLICLMECFYILFFEEDILKDKMKKYIFALIVGIAVSIKITNVIFLIPICLYYIIKNISDLKYLKLYDWFILLVLAVLPWIIYAVSSYIQTGNPVFPYYNNIFNSEYFMDESWKDIRFGPKNFIQFLIWPIYIVFNPLKAFDTKFVDTMWGIGFITCVIYILCAIKNYKSRNKKLFLLACTIIINSYLWELMLVGYVRYANIILVLNYVLVTGVIFSQFWHKRWITYGLTIFVLSSTVLALGYSLLVLIKDYQNVEEFWLDYKANFNLIIKDRKNLKLSIGGELGAINDDSLLPSLVRNNEPIYNLEERMTITNAQTEELYNSKIINKDIFVIVDQNTLKRKKECLVENEFEILEEDELKDNLNFLSPSDRVYLLRVRKK